jgi:hypothetical protein
MAGYIQLALMHQRLERNGYVYHQVSGLRCRIRGTIYAFNNNETCGPNHQCQLTEDSRYTDTPDGCLHLHVLLCGIFEKCNCVLDFAAHIGLLVLKRFPSRSEKPGITVFAVMQIANEMFTYLARSFRWRGLTRK